MQEVRAGDDGPGVLAIIVLLVGAGCLLIALVSVFSIAHGASTSQLCVSSSSLLQVSPPLNPVSCVCSR